MNYHKTMLIFITLITISSFRNKIHASAQEENDRIFHQLAELSWGAAKHEPKVPRGSTYDAFHQLLKTKSCRINIHLATNVISGNKSFIQSMLFRIPYVDFSFKTLQKTLKRAIKDPNCEKIVCYIDLTSTTWIDGRELQEYRRIPLQQKELFFKIAKLLGKAQKNKPVIVIIEEDFSKANLFFLKEDEAFIKEYIKPSFFVKNFFGYRVA